MRKAKVVYHVSDIEARAPANLISVIVVYHVSDIEAKAPSILRSVAGCLSCK